MAAQHGDARPRRQDRPPWQHAAALAIPFAAAGIQLALWTWLQPLVWLLFYPAVFLSARVGGRRDGGIATITSVVLAWYFFIPPRFSFLLSGPHQLIQIAIFAASCALVVDLVGRLEKAYDATVLAADETESKYRALVDQSLVGIYVIQNDRFRFVNPLMAQMLGYDSPAELVDTVSVVSLVPPDERAAAQQRVDEADAGHMESAMVMAHMIRRDGAVISMERYGRIIDYEGQPAIIGAVRDITQAEKDRRLLEQREALLAETSELAHVGGWELDPVNGRGEWTEEVARIHGIDPEVQPNASLSLSYYDPDSRPVLEAAVNAAIEDGTPYDLELGFTSESGEHKWVRTTGEAIRENGKTVRLHGTMQDVTERRNAEAARLESEEQYRELFDSMNEGLAHCRMFYAEDGTPEDWVYLQINPAFETITGITGATGRLVSDLLPGIRESNPELFEIYGRVAQLGTAETFDTYVPLLPRGQWLHIAVTSPAPGEFVAIFTDVTERKLAQDALAESEARYRNLFDTLREGVAYCEMIYDEKGAPVDWRYLSVNPEYYALNGSSDIVGRTASEALPSLMRDNDELLERFDRVARTGEPAEFDEYLPHLPIGPRWLHASASRPAPGQFIVALTNVTERVTAEAEVRELNASLERRVELRTAEVQAANKELEAFAYAVSHDLRAPLRAMSGFSQALVEDYGESLDAQAKDYIDHIQSGSKRMGELIDGLLGLSRATRGELQRATLDVSAVSTSLLEEHARNRPERDVEWHVEPGLAVDGDSAMIGALLGNLVGNAWKYSRETEHARIDIFAEQADGKRWICVRDNGAGYDPAFSDQLFKPFQRLHRQDEFNGIGIGLATVLRIVDRHGGQIRSTGEVGHGATFCFWLPEGADTPSSAAGS